MLATLAPVPAARTAQRRQRVPWYVAGGWALDLCRGGQIREHEDIEIGVPAGEAFAEVRRALARYEFEVVGSGMSWPLDSPAFAVMHQIWVSEWSPDRSDGRGRPHIPCRHLPRTPA